MVQTWIMNGVSLFMLYAASMLVVIFLADAANQGWKNLFGDNWKGPEERMWHHLLIWPLVPIIAVILIAFAILGMVNLGERSRA